MSFSRKLIRVLKDSWLSSDTPKYFADSDGCTVSLLKVKVRSVKGFRILGDKHSNYFTCVDNQDIC